MAYYQQQGVPPPPPPQQVGYYGQQQYPQNNAYQTPPPPPPQYQSYDQQQYQQNAYAAPPPQQSAPYNGGGYEKFSTKVRFNDLWAAIFFLVHLIGFIVLAAFAIPKGFNSTTNSIIPSTQGRNRNSDIIQFVIMMAVAAVIAFVLSMLYLLAMQR
jgi:hypothetical protein